MVSHLWGDKDFDWESLDRAIEDIMEFCTKWGRLTCHGKEKYGTARISVYFWSGSIRMLINPNIYLSDYTKWWVKLDIKFASILGFLQVVNLFHKWQIFIYKLALKRAVKKFPHLKQEILQDNDLY